jgi:hypothetical protein
MNNPLILINEFDLWRVHLQKVNHVINFLKQLLCFLLLNLAIFLHFYYIVIVMHK